jgi:hypothetical protein
MYISSNAARGIRLLADWLCVVLARSREGHGVFFLWRPAAMLDVRGSSERVDRPTHCSSQSWSAARLILFNEARLHSAVSCSCFIIINDSASGDHLFARGLCCCRFFSTLVMIGCSVRKNYGALRHFAEWTTRTTRFELFLDGLRGKSFGICSMTAFCI